MRKRPLGLWIAALTGYAFLYVPLVIVVVYSFNNSRLNAEWVGFTLDWYDKLFHNQEMLAAAGNSLLIALTASAVSTVLGTMAGVAMYRYRARLLQILVLAPIAIPEILMGVSLLIFFVLLNFTLGLVSVALAHIAFCIGFVAIVVRARLAGMDETLTEVARDCGASPWNAFRYITLPLIMPGVIAGALMAFTLSIDDFVITFFTAGAGTVTLPLQIYSMIKIAVTPEVNAVSSLLMLLTLALIIIASKVSPSLLRSEERREPAMRGSAPAARGDRARLIDARGRRAAMHV
jgi:spermidine/putrescine transport system permease protein